MVCETNDIHTHTIIDAKIQTNVIKVIQLAKLFLMKDENFYYAGHLMGKKPVNIQQRK